MMSNVEIVEGTPFIPNNHTPNSNRTIWPNHRFICWGSGKHSQHCHSNTNDVGFKEGPVDFFSPSNRETTVKFVACGSSHTVVVTKTNDVYVWGNNHCGQLGCGDDENRKLPVKIQLYALQRENPDINGVACGGRHTFVWLNNGNVFSFGNNTFAQLGYDFKIKNYRDNQKKPHLLRTISHRAVQQVACGEKHTVFLFKGGHVATVGNGSLGQIGNNSRNEAVVPTNLEDVPPIKYVAAGAFHSVAIDVTGEIWCWGFGSACGYNKTDGDLLKPVRYPTRHPNIVQVECGHTHNVALSANGSVYTWGYGPDGQLGHGDCTLLTNVATKLPFADLKVRTAHVGCGESYTVAISESGQLFMWGKNSHVISIDTNSSTQFYNPQLLNTSDTPLKRVICGSWHSTAIAGKPDWNKEDNSSDNEDDHTVELDGDTESIDMELGALQREDTVTARPGLSREMTTISLADFYAPSPSPTQNGKSPSPDIMTGRKKLPSYLEPMKHTSYNFKKKNQVIWKAAAPLKHQPLKLGTIEQSPNMPKKESLDMKISRLEAASPRYSLHQIDVNNTTDTTDNIAEYNKEKKEISQTQELILPKLEPFKTNMSHLVDINELYNRKTSKTPTSKDSEETLSLNSYKTYKTHKSQAAEQLHDKMAVQPQLHHIEGKIPQSNYARQHSPPKLMRTRTYHNPTNVKMSAENDKPIAKNKLFSLQSDPNHKHQFNPPKPKMFISRTRLNFLSPEPLPKKQQSHNVARTLKRKRLYRNAISQPTELWEREGTIHAPSGFRGNGFLSRNESQQSSVPSTWMQPTAVNDIFTSPTMRKLSNAPSIALQRLNAKQRIEKSLNDYHSNNVSQPAFQESATNIISDTDRNVKRTLAVPQRVNFMAQDLIKRKGNCFDNFAHQHMPSMFPKDFMEEMPGQLNRTKQKDKNSPLKSIGRRFDVTVGVMNNSRIS